MKNKDLHQSIDFIRVLLISVCSELVQEFRKDAHVAGHVSESEFCSAMKWATQFENTTIKTISNIVVYGAGSIIVYKQALSHSKFDEMTLCRKIFAPFWSAFHKTIYERLILQEEYDYKCMAVSGLDDLKEVMQRCSVLTRNGEQLFQGADAIQEEFNREAERSVPKRQRKFSDYQDVMTSLKSRSDIRDGVFRMASIHEQLPGDSRPLLNTESDVRGIRRITRHWFDDVRGDKAQVFTIYGERVQNSDSVSSFYSQGLKINLQRNRELAVNGKFISKNKKIKVMIEEDIVSQISEPGTISQLQIWILLRVHRSNTLLPKDLVIILYYLPLKDHV